MCIWKTRRGIKNSGKICYNCCILSIVAFISFGLILFFFLLCFASDQFTRREAAAESLYIREKELDKYIPSSPSPFSNLPITISLQDRRREKLANDFFFRPRSIDSALLRRSSPSSASTWMNWIDTCMSHRAQILYDPANCRQSTDLLSLLVTS